MKLKYIDKKISPEKQAVIDQANAIIEEYQQQGFDLTLRQLYYQFVARDIIANKQSEYKRLGVIISDGRLAGLIDWKAIVDRTRNLKKNNHWKSPAQIVRSCADWFKMDKWVGQDYRPEVWIEKDALIGVIEGACSENDVAYFSCRGYTSQSEMHAAAMRLKRYQKVEQTPVIIHLGDHDPSGVDMTRDIADRMELFTGGRIEVKRIALNMNQVDRYKPPPNPSKITDPRAGDYIKRYGMKSWELDALEPKVLSKLIDKTIDKFKDGAIWQERVDLEDEHKERLSQAAVELEAEEE